MFSYFLRGALHSEKNSFSCYVYLFLAQSTRPSRFEGGTGSNYLKARTRTTRQSITKKSQKTPKTAQNTAPRRPQKRQKAISPLQAIQNHPNRRIFIPKLGSKRKAISKHFPHLSPLSNCNVCITCICRPFGS